VTVRMRGGSGCARTVTHWCGLGAIVVGAGISEAAVVKHLLGDFLNAFYPNYFLAWNSEGTA
jgi:hypothetical protein